MKYDWLGRFFQGRLILWYFQFPAGINQSRVADQFPVQGDDLDHGAASGKPGPSVDVGGFVSCPVSAADTGVETRESTMELQSSAA